MTIRLRLLSTIIFFVLAALSHHANGQSGVYDVIWTDVEGISYTGNTLTKTASDGWGNAGAASLYYLKESTDGWIEYTVEVINQRKAFGLANQNSSHYHGSINYGFSFGTDSKVYLWHSGAELATSPIAVGDILRIERAGSTIYYKKNGTTLYTLTGGIAGNLIPDIAMYLNGGVFSNLKASFGPDLNASLHWANTVGVTFSGNDILRNRLYVNGYGEAAAFSVESLPAGQDGWVEVTLQETASVRMIGLASTDVNSSNAMEFGIQFSENGNLHIVEDGVTIGYVGKYVSGSVARVAREGNQIKYFIDNVLKHASSKTSTAELHVDVAIRNHLATLKNVTVNNFVLDTIPEMPTTIPWEEYGGIQVDESNNLIKTASSGYGNAGAVSTATLPAGADGWVEMVAAETNTSRMIGLSEYDRDDGTDIEFAIEFNSQEEVHVFEDGVQKNYMGQYTTGTVAHIAREGGQVKYYLDGTLKATSLKTSASSLIVDAAINDTNGTITGIQVSPTFTRTVGGPLGAFKDFYDALGGSNWSSSWPVSNGWPLYLNLEDVLDWNGITDAGWIRFYLRLPSNNLTGVVPASLWKTPGLSVLDLSDNNITDVLMPVDFNIYDVWEIDLSYNKIASLSESFGNIGFAGTQLYLHHNLLSSLSDNFAYLHGVYTLDLSHNQLSSLPEAYLYSNSWVGHLNLSYNQFTSFPEPLCGMFYLSSLDLSHNSIRSITESLFPSPLSFSALSSLDLSYNELVQLPESLADLSLSVLDLSHNELEAMPETFEFVGHTLNLSHNRLVSLPLGIDAYYVDVSNNMLDFATLETLISQSANVTYAPQQTIVDIKLVSVKLGTQLVVPARDKGQYSSVVWEKKQPNGTWVNVNSINDDASGQTFTRNTATSSDLGVYRWSMTNSLVTGMVLQSGEIEVREAVSVVLDDFAFRYKYDARKRMTRKKVPGADWVYMVYDDRDRLVMSQDGNQRAANPREWTFTKYDALNRPVLTGIYKDTEGLDQPGMQEAVDDFYEALGPNDSYKWHEDSGSAVHGYTNRSFPDVSAESDYLTVTYYDNYNFICGLPGAGTCDDPYSGPYKYDQNQLSTDGEYEAQEASEFRRVVGQVTGTKVKNLVTGEWYHTINYYDDRYRLIQTFRQNHLGGLDKITNVYDFPGRVTRTKTSHTTTGQPEISVVKKMKYDDGGRLIRMYHKVNNAPEVLLAKMEYNELGQLVDKKLYSTNGGTTFAQSVDHRYNIRGWLTSLNNSELAVDGGETNDDTGDLFGMTLSYDEPVAGITDSESVQFNGNISAITYSTVPYTNGFGFHEITERGYRFTYDGMNRLLDAIPQEKDFDWYESSTFREGGLSYDLNGNIKTLLRTDIEESEMDNLVYTYTGNQLQKVEDTSGNDAGFRDGVDSNNEYLYDANGNMIGDRNKGIEEIYYNHLNLPDQVTKTSTEYIRYTYDAQGVKLVQEVFDTNNQLVKRSDYIGEFFYEDGNLKFIHHDEGRVIMEGGTPEYQYNLKDHLGSVRLTFTAQPETETVVATMENVNEEVESTNFINYDEAVKINTPLFDHTYDGTTGQTYYSTRLVGGNTNEIYGLAKSLSVMPGDTIKAEVYAKYLDPDQYSWTPALANFLETIAFGTAPPETLVDGGTPGSAGPDGFPFAGFFNRGGYEYGDPPKAYLNYIVFDKNFDPIDGGFVRITTACKENGEDVPHEKLELPQPLVIRQPGYVYIYVSNENEDPVEVFFDDFKVEHIKSLVVQMEEYYPFGLQFNSYSRENSVENRYLYNQGKEGKDEIRFNSERVFDLGLNVDQSKYRTYDYITGRWWQIDPKADSLENFTPYNYSFNNPIRYNDPMGDCPPDDPDCGAGRGGMSPVRAAIQSNVTSNLRSAGNNASNIVSGQVGVQAAGIGAKVKIAGVVHIEAQGKAGVVELSMSSNGPDASISAVTTDFGAQIGPLGGSYSQNDMTFDGNSFQMRESDGSFSAGSLQYGTSSNEISIGGALGNLSAEVSANLDAASAAISDTVEAVKGFFQNLLPNPWQN